MNTKTNVAASGGFLHRLVRRFFGIPIWTDDHDGEMRKRWAKPQVNGTLKTTDLAETIILNADGTVRTDGYVERWYHRKSIFSANDQGHGLSPVPKTSTSNPASHG